MLALCWPPYWAFTSDFGGHSVRTQVVVSLLKVTSHVYELFIYPAKRLGKMLCSRRRLISCGTWSWLLSLGHSRA